MGGDTIKYLTCNSDAFRVTMVDNKTNTGHTLVKYIRAVKYKLLISDASMRTDLTILSKSPVVRTADLTCKTWREQFVRAGCVLA